MQAKGVEDTAGYRWSRLVALNEVGCDPDRFGVRPAEFHAVAGRLAADWPATMTTLSTHDTKRQEDVRARLAVLAELPREWGRQVRQWHERAVTLRSYGRAAAAVDPDTEYLFWQTLVGAWPISGERLAGYLTKAIREAKWRTSWTSPDQEYEAAVLGLAARVLDDPELSGSVAGFVAGIAARRRGQLARREARPAHHAGSARRLPGVRAGRRCPWWTRTTGGRWASHAPVLTSPRSTPARTRACRRPGATATSTSFSMAKLLVTSRALRLRRARPEWFAGGYEPLTATGAAAAHVIAFRRGGQAVTVVTRLPVSLRRAGGWRDTALRLPGGAWADLLTGAVHRGGAVPLAELTGRLPVALLVPGG